MVGPRSGGDGTPAAFRGGRRLAARHPHLTAAVGGTLAALSFPPRYWWVFAPLGLALLTVALHGRGWRSRLASGAAFGIGLFATSFAFVWAQGVPWLVVAAEIIAALILSTFVVLAAVLTPPGRGLVVGLPAALVASVALQSYWPFGGLPAVDISFGQVGGPFADIARIGGHYALVAVTGLTGVALAAPFVHPRGRRVAVGLLGVVLVSLVAGALSPRGEPVREVSVAIVQGGGVRGVRAMTFEETYRHQMEAAERIDGPVDLVVLAEGTAHVDAPLEQAAQVKELGELARRLDTTLVAGVIVSLPGERFSNEAIAWNPDGEIVGRYVKVHGVPFAEYMPARRLLDAAFDVSDLVPADMVAGDRPGTLTTPAGRLGLAVSFEVFFSRLVGETITSGAEMIVVPTNAGSFTDSEAPSFEVSASRVRAVESGRYLLQVTPTGYTAVIDPMGRVLATTELDETEVIQRRVQLRRGLTVFSRVGEFPMVVLALLGLGAGWGAELAAARRRTGGRPADRVAAPVLATGAEEPSVDGDGTTGEPSGVVDAAADSER